MNWLKRVLRLGFDGVERALDLVFPPGWNPVRQLGALGFFYYWVVAVSGIYIYIFFDTSVVGAYQSVERMTHGQWYAAGVMRSLHRYASDALVVMALFHLAREFALDHLRGVRWFSWFTGVPLLWLLYASGVTGYWLVWDKLAQYVAVASVEWLDGLPIFGQPIARNFLSPESLDDRFFTLLVFMHIAVPLILLFVMWLHLQRVVRPRINPPRGLACVTFAMLVALSLVKPALSQGPANLATVPAEIGLDWFYLALYPLLDRWSAGEVWALAGVATLIVAAMPWLPPLRRAKVAVVALDQCNGCRRCALDCPYAAIMMQPRSDGRPFSSEAVVDPDRCVSCGICVGSCPMTMPFRRRSALATGIDLPQFPLPVMIERLHQAAAALQGRNRVMVIGCDHGPAIAPLSGKDTAALGLPCIGMLSPTFIDYILSRDLADGVLLTGCREDGCYNRQGVLWTEQRLAGTRDPYLRARVPRERLATAWVGAGSEAQLAAALAAFRARLAALPAQAPPPPPRSLETVA